MFSNTFEVEIKCILESILNNIGDVLSPFSQRTKRKKLIHSEEASYFDIINMTENGLDFDRKIFIPTNLNIGT